MTEKSGLDASRRRMGAKWELIMHTVLLALFNSTNCRSQCIDVDDMSDGVSLDATHIVPPMWRQESVSIRNKETNGNIHATHADWSKHTHTNTYEFASHTRHITHTQYPERQRRISHNWLPTMKSIAVKLRIKFYYRRFYPTQFIFIFSYIISGIWCVSGCCCCCCCRCLRIFT